MSTVGHLQFSGYDHSLPWSKPIHPLRGKSLHCTRPLVGEEENVIFNFSSVYLPLTFSVLVLTALATKGVCVHTNVCVCVWRTGAMGEAARENHQDCMLLSSTSHFPLFLLVCLSLCVSVSFISMADLLLLMLVEYSWMWGHDENLLTPKSQNPKVHLVTYVPPFQLHELWELNHA